MHRINTGGIFYLIICVHFNLLLYIYKSQFIIPKTSYFDCKYFIIFCVICEYVIFILYFPAWSNMKITKELQERQRIDEIRFQKAGTGPLIKTYKYDPTKPRPNASVQAKQK